MWVGEFFLFRFAPLGGPSCILLVYMWGFPGFFFDEYFLPFTHQKKIFLCRKKFVFFVHTFSVFLYMEDNLMCTYMLVNECAFFVSISKRTMMNEHEA